MTPALALLLTSACGRVVVGEESPPGADAQGSGTGGAEPTDTDSAQGGGTDSVQSGGTGNGAGPTSGTGGGTNSQNMPGAPTFDCSEVASQQFDATVMQPYRVSAEVQEKVNDTLVRMSPAEKAAQMMGVPVGSRDYRDIQRSPDVQVADVGVIRGYRYRDAGRGVNLDAGQDNRPDDANNYATVFPTASLRAASWDLELERRVGAAIGDETAASKNNALMAPCMNVTRHPYWGRVQETYGEDSYHIGRMATAMAVGIQEYVVGCAKHFAANNIEKGRSKQNAIMDEQTLREVYGRHFEMVVQDGGIGCVMAAYNLVNGVKSTQNEHLLRDVLKAPIDQGGMGFEGFVITDWWAMPGDQDTSLDAVTAQAVANEAVVAGTDVEVPWQIHYSEATLANADQGLIEEAARRVLTQKFRFATAMDTDAWGKKPPSSVLDGDSIAPNDAHEALAEEVAIKSAVLLQNGPDATSPVLPLSRASHIAVVGLKQQFAQISSSVPKSCPISPDIGQGQITVRECVFDFGTDPALGDRGSSRVNGDPERSVGPFAGIQEIAGPDRSVTSGNSAAEAADADAVVVVVGYSAGDEGEEYYLPHGGDRSSLDLPLGHAELVQSVLDLNKPTVIIIESGSLVNVPWLAHANKNQATIWAGYPGQRGGLALGKLIFGQENFSGKLPMAWPAEHELPSFKDSDSETSMGYFFGYREFDRRKYVEGKDVELVFPFGHGLSYARFDYANLTLPCQSVSKEAIFNVSVDITNTTGTDGDEVAMLFVKPPPTPSGVTGQRPWKELKSFARVSVPAGETVTATLPLRVRDLRHWEGREDGHWVTDGGEYTILVGRDAADAESARIAGTVIVNGD